MLHCLRQGPLSPSRKLIICEKENGCYLIPSTIGVCNSRHDNHGNLVLVLLQPAFDTGGEGEFLYVVKACILSNDKATQILK